VDEIAKVLESGGSINVAYDAREYDGKNPVLELFRLYGVELPLRTQGWVNTTLAAITADGYSRYTNIGGKKRGESEQCLAKFKNAVKLTPIERKRGIETEEPVRQNNKIENGGEKVEYSQLQQKGFEIARKCESLPLQERLNIIAQTFEYKTASVETHPCTGKWRGTSDISINLGNGRATLFIGNKRTPDAKKASTINECVNNALAKYNPQIVAEAKQRAAIALMERERTDNAVAAEQGLKPYTLLNVELNDGSNSKTGGYLGWYFVTVAVDGKIFGLCESNLNSDIERGEFRSRENYFVAGGLRNIEPDFVFNNVGHSSESASYKMELTADVLSRARETLARRERFSSALEGLKEAESRKPTLENRLYDKLNEMFPDFMNQKYSYMRLEAPGFEPLSLEWIFGDRVSIMHTYVQEGDLMYDPMIEFVVNSADKMLNAVAYQNSGMGLYQYYDEDGRGMRVDGNGNYHEIRNLSGKLNTFSQQWFNNLEEQGHIPVRAMLWNDGGIDDVDVQVTFDKDGTPIIEEAEDATEPATENNALAEMSEYGYTDVAAMYPLTNERAVELFESGNPVYLLYPDNTEAMAFDVDEIKVHDGLCGIEVNDWERIQAAETSRADEKPAVNENTRVSESNAREADLLFGDKNKFGIYQIRDGIDEARNFRFAPMRELEALGLSVDRANYELVYTGELPIRDTQTNLHRIYGVFQHDSPECPQDFAARSVSVSDVIVLQWRGEVSSHFVDSVGFVELSSFTGDERNGDSFSQVGKSAESEKPKEGLRLIDKEPRKAQKTANKGILDELDEAQQLAESGGKQEHHNKSERGYE
jgi:hypothetical protein